MPSTEPLVGILLPSFNDERIVHTVMSIRLADPEGVTRIYVIDGGSSETLLATIRKCLRDHDVLTSERDKGVFDALNKGLDTVREPYLGWLGSDDFYTGEMNFSELASRFERDKLDCVLFAAALLDDVKVRRVTYPYPPTLNSYRLGRFVPHFSSFWSRDAIGDKRFDLRYAIAADHDFFLRVITQRRLRFHTDQRIGTGARLGGISTGSWKRIYQANRDCIEIYSRYMGRAVALFAVSQKLLSKLGLRQLRERPPLMGDTLNAVIAAAKLQ